MVTREEAGRNTLGGDWDRHVHTIYTIGEKDLLRDTENRTRYSAMACIGTESGGGYVCVCVYI